MIPFERLSLAILSGGLSSRFGSDKGLYQIPGHNSFSYTLAQRLGPFFAETLLITHDEQQHTRYQEAYAQLCQPCQNFRLVSDHESQPELPRSTLSGITSALSLAKGDFVAIIAVDQIALTIDDLFPLANHANSNYYRPARPVAYLDGHSDDVLPLPSVWPKEMTKVVLEKVERGELSVRTCLAGLDAVLYDPGRSLYNLRVNVNNRPELSLNSDHEKQREKQIWRNSLI